MIMIAGRNHPSWPPTMRTALRRHVRRALERLDPNRYFQEPAYIAALLARLDGVVYKGRAGRLEIRSTIVADRGPHSAESRWGADFGIVAVLDNQGIHIEKGVLAQAKKGSLNNLQGSAAEAFLGQCEKMSVATTAILGLEVPTRFAEPVIVREVNIRRSMQLSLLEDQSLQQQQIIGRPQELADYLAGRLLRCSHGDHTPNFVHGVRDSNLSHLLILAESAHRM